MLTINGDILSVNSGVILHGVNGQGRMGSGLAKQIRDRYPDVYADYIRQGKMQLGSIVPTRITKDLFVVSGCTQEFYGKSWNIVYTSYKAIDEVFEKTIDWMKPYGLNKLCFPRIGAGLGNGNWNIILPIILQHQLANPKIELKLYEYDRVISR